MKYVGEIERGRANPMVGLMWRLSGALRVDVFELFLFSVADNDHDSRLRIQLVRLLKERRGRELERAAQILRLMVE